MVDELSVEDRLGALEDELEDLRGITRIPYRPPGETLLEDGSLVSTDVSPRFRLMNFIGASVVRNGDRADIRIRGGGGFCYDYLVIKEWADEVAAGRGAEGDEQPNGFGGTFLVYSTIQAAVTHIEAATLGTLATVFICSGTYAETVVINRANLATAEGIEFIGESAESVNIGQAAGGSDAIQYSGSSNCVLRFRHLNLGRNSTGVSVHQTSGTHNTEIHFEDVIFKGSLEGTFTNCSWRFCEFQDLGIKQSGSEDWAGLRFTHCEFATGAVMTWAGAGGNDIIFVNCVVAIPSAGFIEITDGNWDTIIFSGCTDAGTSGRRWLHVNGASASIVGLFFSGGCELGIPPIDSNGKIYLQAGGVNNFGVTATTFEKSDGRQDRYITSDMTGPNATNCIFQGITFGRDGTGANNYNEEEDAAASSIHGTFDDSVFGPNAPAGIVQYDITGTSNEFYPAEAAIGPSVSPTVPFDLLWAAATELTIATGVITATQSHHTIDTESDAATDDLNTINGLVANQLYFFRPANDARTIVLKHGTGNIECIGNADLTLDDDHDFVWAFSPDGSNVYAFTVPPAKGIELPVIGTPTYTNLEDLNTVFHSTGWISPGGVISDAGGATINVTGGDGMLRASDSVVAQLKFIEWPASNGLAITANSIRYIGVELNDPNDPQVVVRTSENFNHNTDFPLGTVVNEAGTLHVQNAPWEVGDHASAMIQRARGTAPIARDKEVGGIIFSETGTRNVAVTAGQLWRGLTAFVIGALDTDPGGAADTFDEYSSQGKENTGTAAWPNTLYDNGSGGTGSLQTIGNNKWANLWWYIELDGELVMVYGTAQYNTQAQAEAEAAPTTIPNRLQVHGTLAARFIFKESAATAAEILSAFDTTFAVVGVTDHGNLAGIADTADHAYALLIDGSRPLTANWAPGAFDIGNYDFTARSLRFEAGDTDFQLELNSGVPTIFFDTVANDELRYRRDLNLWQFRIGGTTAVAIDATSLRVNQIDEATATVGVTIDGVLIKDALIAATYLPDASVTAQGVVELATAAEVNTGTDATRAITPDSLADSNFTALKTISITVEDPGNSEDLGMGFLENAFTITKVYGVVIGSSTPSIDIDLRHHTDRSNAGNAVLDEGGSADLTINNTTTPDSSTSFNDATLPAGSFLWLETNGKSGTITQLQVWVIGHYD